MIGKNRMSATKLGSGTFREFQCQSWLTFSLSSPLDAGSADDCQESLMNEDHFRGKIGGLVGLEMRSL